VQTLTHEGLTALAPTILAMARAEGFTAHANSVTARLERTP
jgi:histidinol dehydrogenase